MLHYMQQTLSDSGNTSNLKEIKVSRANGNVKFLTGSS